VFGQVEEAIILEDDCLPDQTFFRFCQEMLERYRNDQRVGMISGDNFQFGTKRSDASYYFSCYNHIWGWASWRRAWESYDVNMKLWPRFRDDRYLDYLFADNVVRNYWHNAFEATHSGRIDTWDYQWVFTSWVNNMISVMPNVNLISNIGFGANATHTIADSVFSSMPVEPITFPLQHPDGVYVNIKADKFTADNQFSTSLIRRVLGKIKRIIKF